MRYKVLEGSQSAHCCFGATVVDMTSPKTHNGKPITRDGKPVYHQVCETFSTDDADMIAAALNRAGDNA